MEDKSNRRNMLKLCAVAILGGMASILGMKVIPKAKAEGETVVVGGEYSTATSRTMISGDVGDNGIIESHHYGTGKGLIGTSSHKFGIVGISTYWDGIRGRSLTISGNGVGVQGFGNILESNGPYGTGVRGVGSRDGVRGTSNASSGNGVGVQGFGNIVEDDGDYGTGVRGVGSSIGVIGECSGSGIGVKAKSSLGTALHVEGTNYFESAQRGTISTGVRYYDVNVPKRVMISSDAMIFVTLMNNPSNIGVKYVERLSDIQFRIHLTGTSRNNMYFGYFIVN